VEAAVSKFSDERRANLENHPRWAEVSERLNDAEQRFLSACAEKGVQPSDVSKLQEGDRLRGAKQAELAVKQKQLTSLHQQAAQLERALATLHAVWRAQYEARKAACEALQGPTTAVTASFM